MWRPLFALVLVSGCSLLVPDVTSRFGAEEDAGDLLDGGTADAGAGGDAGPLDASVNDAGAGDAGTLDAGFCAAAGAFTWCETFEGFDAGRYVEATPFDGGNGVVVDPTRGRSTPASLRVVHAAGAPSCSDALLLRDFATGPVTGFTLSVAVRFEARQPETSLFYVHRGTGNAICAIYVSAMTDGRLSVLEQLPSTPGQFDFVLDESDAGLSLQTWHQVELDFSPSNTIALRLDGRLVHSRPVTRACTGPNSGVEFKLGSVCTSTAAQARTFWLDDVVFRVR